MGYEAWGDLTVSVPPDSEITIALDMHTLEQALTRPYSGTWTLPTRRDPDDSLVERILRAVYVEVHGAEIAPAGTVVLSGFFNGKWSDRVEQALQFLASHGCGITGTFTGEDDTRWAYRTPVGAGVLTEEGLTSVTDSDIRQMTAALHLVQALRDLSRTCPEDDAFARQTRALLTGPPADADAT